ncbi:MAG: hypothetical protein KA368_09025 [Acidobacteria bacterium]|nr:hypothetical protein [Acidobacteriota bacterium]
MKEIKKFIFVVSITTALVFNASASVQWLGQEKKPPEKVKEQPKPDKGKDQPRGNDRKDDKKDDKKKPL